MATLFFVAALVAGFFAVVCVFGPREGDREDAQALATVSAALSLLAIYLQG